MQVFPVFQLIVQATHPPVVGLQPGLASAAVLRPPFVHVLLQQSRRAKFADLIEGRCHQLVDILRRAKELNTVSSLLKSVGLSTIFTPLLSVSRVICNAASCSSAVTVPGTSWLLRKGLVLISSLYGLISSDSMLHYTLTFQFTAPKYYEFSIAPQLFYNCLQPEFAFHPALPDPLQSL